MTIISVNTKRDFSMPELIQDVMGAKAFFLSKVGASTKSEVTYKSSPADQWDLKFVFTGNFDKAGDSGRIKQIEIFDHGKSLLEIKQFDLNLSQWTNADFITRGLMLALLGVSQNETYFGGRGNDTVLAFGGELHGWLGNDTFLSAGVTHYDGGSGLDTVSYLSDQNIAVKKGLTISLADPSINTGEAKGDTYNSIEIVRGSNGNDTIYDDIGASTLIGKEGDDILIGNKGADTLWGDIGIDFASYETAGATTGVGVTACLGGPQANTGDAKGDSYRTTEGLIGSAYADILIGDVEDNIIKGGAGDDQIDGGRGIDELWGDSEVFGVSGSDVFVINGKGLKTIMDYDVFDVVKINRADFGLGQGFQIVNGTTYIVKDGAAAETENATFFFDSSTDKLYFDADGTGSGKAELLAKVNFHSQQYLDAFDFFLV